MATSGTSSDGVTRVSAGNRPFLDFHAKDGSVRLSGSSLRVPDGREIALGDPGRPAGPRISCGGSSPGVLDLVGGGPTESERRIQVTAGGGTTFSGPALAAWFGSGPRESTGAWSLGSKTLKAEGGRPPSGYVEISTREADHVAVVGGGLSVGSALPPKAPLHVRGNSEFSGGVSVEGALSVDGVTRLDGDVRVGRGIIVGAAADLGSSALVRGNLRAMSDAKFEAGVKVERDLMVAGGCRVVADLQVDRGFRASSAVDFGSDCLVRGHSRFVGDLNAESSARVEKDLVVVGGVRAGSVSVSGGQQAFPARGGVSGGSGLVVVPPPRAGVHPSAIGGAPAGAGMWLGVPDSGAVSVFVGAREMVRFDAKGMKVLGGTKNFEIPHPLAERGARGDVLRHSCVESPLPDLHYRGRVRLRSGRARVDVDAASGMARGTFAALTAGTRSHAMVFLQAVESFSSVTYRWSPDNPAVFEVEVQPGGDRSAAVNWMVVAERSTESMGEGAEAFVADPGATTPLS